MICVKSSCKGLLPSVILIMGLIGVGECNKCINKIMDTVNLSPGLCFSLLDNAVSVKLDIPAEDLGRTHHQEMAKRPNMLQRFGALLVMIPILMQLLSMPGAVATIKMSLLKSLFVGKLALMIMLYNLLRSFRPASEVVVVHHPQPSHQHYEHYYHPYEEEDQGWFG